MKYPIKWLLGITGIALLASCSKSHSGAGTASDSSSTVVTTPTTSVLSMKSPITDPRLKELSGIAASVLHPHLLYTHNDSGDSSRFFALGIDGSVQAVFHYNADPHGGSLGVTDVEDIAVGPGPAPSASYVYLGDIGDNNAVRKFVVIYRVPEPALPAAGGWASVTADALFLRYPDGAHDAETLIVDPIDRLLYIVSKREDSVGVYSTPLDFKTNDTVLLTLQTKLFFPGTGEFKYITAGDVSQKGGSILLKSYTTVYLWQRKTGVSVWKTMLQQPILLPYTIEPQGEAIGFSSDGKKYYTTSEGTDPLLYEYLLK